VKIYRGIRIVLLGPPGSGKGTQSARLSRAFRIPHISTGDILRKLVSGKSPLSKKIKSFMEKGKLVPDKIIFSIIALRLNKKDARKGFVLDGFPRNLRQANRLEKIIGKGKALKIFNLKVSNRTIIKRLSGRRVCRLCGANYHIQFQPPKFDNRCDKCGGILYQRDDDKPAAIRNRLKVYRMESAPLIRYYRKRGSFVEIDAEPDEEKIFASIKKYLKNDLYKIKRRN